MSSRSPVSLDASRAVRAPLVASPDETLRDDGGWPADEDVAELDEVPCCTSFSCPCGGIYMGRRD